MGEKEEAWFQAVRMTQEERERQPRVGYRSRLFILTVGYGLLVLRPTIVTLSPLAARSTNTTA